VLVRWAVVVRQYFSLRHNIQTGSGSHPVSHLVGTGVHSSGVKRPELEAAHSPPFSAKVKNACNYYASTSLHIFTEWYLIKRRDTFSQGSALNWAQEHHYLTLFDFQDGGVSCLIGSKWAWLLVKCVLVCCLCFTNQDVVPLLHRAEQAAIVRSNWWVVPLFQQLDVLTGFFPTLLIPLQ
jgi:hypothetical protein